jgi:protein-L-isoaspartate(D-aspartate) O-methyltransferase
MSVDFASQRAIMVESQVRVADVTDYDIQDAMRLVPRETLVPPQKAHQAYAEVEVEYAPGRWLMKPRDVAKLLQAVRPRAGERALAIRAPYAAAVLHALGLTVTRLEEGDLTAQAGALADVYDVIVCEGAVSAVPAAWTAALAVGGRMGVAERHGQVARADLYIRSERDVGRRDLFDCFPPLIPGFEPAAAFTF